MKVYDYIIVLKRPNYYLVDGISQLMLLLAIIVLASYPTLLPIQTGSIVRLVIMASIIGWWIYCYRRQKKGYMPFFRLALLVAAIGWTLQPGWQIVSAVYILAAFLEKQVKFPQEIGFDDHQIVVNSLFKKYYSWDQLTNVVIKDGILTIDFTSNKLIQKEIQTDSSAKDEQEFNDFCKNRIQAESTMLKA